MTIQINFRAVFDCIFNWPGTWFYLWRSQTIGKKGEKSFNWLCDLRYQFFIKASLIAVLSAVLYQLLSGRRVLQYPIGTYFADSLNKSVICCGLYDEAVCSQPVAVYPVLVTG
jgi:hypothetical protein